MHTARAQGWSSTAAREAVCYCNHRMDLGTMRGCDPIVMAGAEAITMLRSVDIRRVNNTFYDDPKKQQERP